METNELFTKAVGMHKQNFEKSFEYVVTLQDQVEKKVIAFIEETALIPEPAKAFYKQWAETVKNGRAAIRKYAAEGYEGVENYLKTTH